MKTSNGNFKVKVLSQQWESPRQSESRLLNMRNREKAIIREVALLCYDTPWVFARSVMPASSLTGYLRQLRHFDNSSLGAMLFKDPSMQRHPFELVKIDGDSLCLPDELKQSSSIWARRCRFELAGKPLMVSEMFLEQFMP